ncbi:hypothetical protein [Thermoflexibacter ruber]|uniref:Outer membrane protein beta-barrel domain-containing protein n=1 Tax=Thermoflexibacter ruber TaxID=1003 RepID=A0A1I2EG49_9BACT|nr:hypothetical protein [Thermoflexibacter ruber]SFE91922.1 hypothetical protein SAMN04488541_10108 [Thermoflexibacter ruber]
MKYILLVIGLVFIFSMQARCQHQYADVIYLKNGKVVKGKIKKIENQIIEFETLNHTALSLVINEIEQIRNERVEGVESPKSAESTCTGFVRFVELAHTVGTGNIMTRFGGLRNTMQGQEINFSYNYALSPSLYIGLGTGYSKQGNLQLIPIFLDLRTDFAKGKWRPFFNFRSGHSFGWSENRQGTDNAGFMVQGNVGIRLMLNHSKSAYFSIGLKSQQIQVNYFIIRNNGSPVPFSERLGHQFIGFHGGFSF